MSDEKEIIEAIKRSAEVPGHVPSRAEFNVQSEFTDYQVLKHFPSWNEAVQAAGLESDTTHINH